MDRTRRRVNLPAALVSQRLARVRRGAFRRWWRRNRALVAVAAALTAIVLGVWGFAISSDTPHGDVAGWADRLYHSVALFGFGGGSITIHK